MLTHIRRNQPVLNDIGEPNILPKVTAFCCSALVSLVFQYSAANAGELIATPGSEECDFLFSGEVQNGDALKIQEGIPSTYSGTTLCLDSPGGNLAEGTKMFHAIWGKDSVATRVQSEAECQSACALAFLGGSLVIGTGAVRSQNAMIEPGAVLGFQSPRLVLSGDDVHRASEVADAYALALTDVSEIFKLTQVQQNGVSGMSDLLFSKILETPPSSTYDIDTIGTASLAGIQVSGVPTPELSWDRLTNVCDTAYLLVEAHAHNLDPESDMFSFVPKSGADGEGNALSAEDRFWRWDDGVFMNFVIRGYPAPSVNETLCRIELSKFAFDREQALPISKRDPSIHNFTVSLWWDAHVPTGEAFADYAQSLPPVRETLSVPWSALWPPQTPLNSFIAAPND